MLRKTMMVLAALATVGTAALAPTAASAGYRHHGHYGHYKSFRWHGPVYSYNYGYGCFKKKWVHGYYGSRLVRVNVCRY